MSARTPTVPGVTRHAQERAVMSRRRHPQEIPVLTAPDRGADGPAMRARLIVMETIEDDTEEVPGNRRFTRTEVARVQDGVLDHYARIGVLTGRRYDAACELSRLYHAGRVAPAGWRTAGNYGGGEMSDERAEAWTEYCRALDHLPKRCEAACMDIARGLFPTGLNAVANMREGFDVLADHWRMPKAGPAGA